MKELGKAIDGAMAFSIAMRSLIFFVIVVAVGLVFAIGAAQGLHKRILHRYFLRGEPSSHWTYRDADSHR